MAAVVELQRSIVTAVVCSDRNRRGMRWRLGRTCCSRSAHRLRVPRATSRTVLGRLDGNPMGPDQIHALSAGPLWELTGGSLPID
jgi:hypothetical protein